MQHVAARSIQRAWLCHLKGLSEAEPVATEQEQVEVEAYELTWGAQAVGPEEECDSVHGDGCKYNVVMDPA